MTSFPGNFFTYPIQLSIHFDQSWLAKLHTLSLKGIDVVTDCGFGGCTKLEYLKLEECKLPGDLHALGEDLAALRCLDKLAIVDPTPCVPVDNLAVLLAPLRLQFLRLDLNNFPRRVSRAEIEACMDVGRNPIVLCAK